MLLRKNTLTTLQDFDQHDPNRSSLASLSQTVHVPVTHGVCRLSIGPPPPQPLQKHHQGFSNSVCIRSKLPKSLISTLMSIRIIWRQRTKQRAWNWQSRLSPHAIVWLAQLGQRWRGHFRLHVNHCWQQSSPVMTCTSNCWLLKLVYTRTFSTMASYRV